MSEEKRGLLELDPNKLTKWDLVRVIELLARLESEDAAKRLERGLIDAAC